MVLPIKEATSLPVVGAAVELTDVVTGALLGYGRIANEPMAKENAPEESWGALRMGDPMALLTARTMAPMVFLVEVEVFDQDPMRYKRNAMVMVRINNEVVVPSQRSPSERLRAEEVLPGLEASLGPRDAGGVREALARSVALRFDSLGRPSSTASLPSCVSFSSSSLLRIEGSSNGLLPTAA